MPKYRISAYKFVEAEDEATAWSNIDEEEGDNHGKIKFDDWDIEEIGGDE